MSFTTYTGSSDEDFATSVSKTEYVVVDFFATWCRPCKRLSEELEKSLDGNSKVTVLKVDVDNYEDLSTSHSVEGLPTLCLYKNGAKTDFKTMGLQKDTISNLLKQLV